MNKNLIVIILGCCAITTAMAKISGSLSIEATTARLQPVGKVKISGVSQQSQKTDTTNTNTPDNIYKKNCAMCHASGLAGAPKLGDSNAWEKRNQKGMDVLMQHVIHGFNAMPPKGGCMKCTPEDLEKVVKYMIEAS